MRQELVTCDRCYAQPVKGHQPFATGTFGYVHIGANFRSITGRLDLCTDCFHYVEGQLRVAVVPLPRPRQIKAVD